MTCVVLALVLLTQAEAPAGRQAGEAEALAQCADCHPGESASWAATGMARALEPLRPGELAGLAPVREEATGFTYSFEGDGATARVVETFERADKPWRDSATIAFAIGAGTLDRAYAVRRHGRLWLAPLEVLGQGRERHAAFAPAHAIAPGKRFAQPVTPECLACHTDSPPPRDWPLNREPEGGEQGWEPRGISCAACHGSLGEHVRARAAELAGQDGGPDPLARERRWTRTMDLERCAACHLQGDARVELDPSRLGPPPPGTPLLATRAVFVARVPGDEIGFVSQVERLVHSRCYLESAARTDGGLRCETCHDPHRALSEPLERERVRAACARCHATGSEPAEASACSLPLAQRPTARDCVDCHLRRTGVFDVAEVRIHDHWIRRRPPPPSPPGALRFPESPGGDWRIFGWPGEEAPADDPGLWTLALVHGGHLERAREFAARGLGTRAKDLPMLHHVRGSLFERVDLPAARAAYERALELDPELAESVVNLAPVLSSLGFPDAALGRLDDLIARHPLADTAYRNRAVVHAALEDPLAFRADLEAALKLLPEARLAVALAQHLERQGDAAAARKWFEEARRLDPRVE